MKFVVRITNGRGTYIEVGSFANIHIANEYAKNVRKRGRKAMVFGAV